MGKIRINELARELEVKSNVVLEYLAGLGIPDKKSHSSALDDDLADKVRAHFRDGGEPTPEVAAPVESPVAPSPAAPVVEAPHVPAGLDLKKIHDFATDLHPLTRSIADIKATARRAVVAPPPPPKPVAPPVAAGPVATPAAPAPSPVVERPLERPAPVAPALAHGPVAGTAVPGRLPAPPPSQQPIGCPMPGRPGQGGFPMKGGGEARQAPSARAGAALRPRNCSMRFTR